MAAVFLGLAALLLVLAASGAIARRWGLSAIPVYLLLGVATRESAVPGDVVHFVEAIGIALLLFFVGLEFSVLRLRREAVRLSKAGLVDLAVNLPVGFAAGLLLGWSPAAAFLLGLALYISSSAIVAANLSQLRRAAFPDTEVALGILVAEDLIIAVLLAGVALWIPAAGGPGGPWITAAGIAVLVLLLTIGSHPAIAVIDRIGEALGDEALLLGISGLLLMFAGGALGVGISEAIGAFALGLLVGDSSMKQRVEDLLGPFQGLFAALFFFGFGLGIDARELLAVWDVGLAVAGIALLSKIASSLWAGRLAGLSLAARLNLGFTLAPRGEFSLLVATYGAAIGHRELGPVVAAVVILLAVSGTLLTQAGPRLATSIAARVPARGARGAREPREAPQTQETREMHETGRPPGVRSG